MIREIIVHTTCGNKYRVAKPKGDALGKRIADAVLEGKPIILQTDEGVDYVINPCNVESIEIRYPRSLAQAAERGAEFAHASCFRLAT